MATIAENLLELQQTKANIKTAIENKGQDLTDVPFTQYGEKIADIQTKEDLDTELNEQETLLAELESSVEGLPEKEIDLSETTATESDVREGKEFFNASGEKVTGTYKDMLQERIDKQGTCSFLFYNYKGASSIDVSGLDVSRATEMEATFQGTRFSIIDLSMWDTSNVTYMPNAFRSPSRESYIKKIILSDTRKVTNANNLFENLEGVTDISTIDMRNMTIVSNMFSYNTALTNLVLKNIKVSIYLSDSKKLSLDSLLNTIKELHTNTGTTTKKLTIGTTNTAKLADVYVKLIDITDEMRAEDELIDNKAPFEVCESTDEGAMLITEYVTTIKKWQLA